MIGKFKELTRILNEDLEQVPNDLLLAAHARIGVHPTSLQR